MILVIAEKPSVAQLIAKVLGSTNRKDGYLEGNGYICSWCVGHLVTLAEPDEYSDVYKKWEISNLPIIPDKFKYKILPATKKQFCVIKKLMNSNEVNSIICATDAGREGELIFRLVYDMAKSSKPFQRLWISSLEDSAIKEGFENLKESKKCDNLYASALCRQRADWLVGMNGTRLFTCLYGNGEVLPIGRVQTPTLNMIVNREYSISTFKTEPFYHTHLILTNGLDLKSNRKTVEEAKQLAEECRSGNILINKVEVKKNSQLPPKLFDLTGLQKEANKLLGYTAQQTLTYTQELYEKKLVTYPRTDSQFLTDDMFDTVKAIIEIISKNLINVNIKTNLKNINTILNSKKVSDHHAIIPTLEIAKMDLSSLPITHKNLLNLISTRLLCATSTPYLFESKNITATACDESFTATGKAVIDLGYKNLIVLFKNQLGIKMEDKESFLPDVVENEFYDISETNVSEHFTKPPKHYTEASILADMEKAGAKEMDNDVERKGLGTPATRAAIIEKLLSDKLIVRVEKNLLPTNKAKNLMKIIPDEIKSPDLTANWENMLVKVAKGEVESTVFMAEIKDIVTSWVKNNKMLKKEYINLFGNSSTEREVLGKCPKCGGSIYENKKAFSCANKDFSLFKDNKFFESFGKKITKQTAKTLLAHKEITYIDLVSKKSGKKYKATIVMSIDDKSNYPIFSLRFDN